MMIFGKRAPMRAPSVLLVLVFAIFTFGLHNGEDSQARADETPPFPSMFANLNEPSTNRQPLARLVTESISESGSVTTQEEYIDLNDGKYAYVMSDTQEVIYVSGGYVSRPTALTLKYKPYTCISFGDDEKVLNGVDGLYELYATNFIRHFRVFGVAGLWLLAYRSDKIYTKSSTNYGVKEFEKVYHTWEYKHALGPVIMMTFNDAFVLEKIEIKNSINAIVKTINVLSIDYDLTNYEDILEVPVGFDCAKHLAAKNGNNNNDASDDNEAPTSARDEFWTDYIWRESRVKLEVTGTKISSYQAGEARTTDTLYVELAHSIMEHPIKEARSDLLMTKIKSKQQETKTIMNHLYGVKYHIDSRTGTCGMSHLDYKTLKANEQDLEDETRDDLVLKFDNGLELPFHKSTIKSLFAGQGTYNLIKTTQRTSQDRTRAIEYRIYEQAAAVWPFPATSAKPGEKLMAHIMATIVSIRDIPTGQNSRPKVESLTIWLLPAEQTKILETYHLSVIDEEAPLELWPDVASLFDVSEECYLNEPTKRSGLDYAWTELFYPLPSRVLETLLDSEFELKETIYRNMVAAGLVSSFSLPRLEVMFGDEGLYVRMLMLDLPPFELLFDSEKESKLYPDADSDSILFVLPDERHCARMCQLHDCLTMTYCKNKNECLVSHRPTRLDYQEQAESDEKYELLAKASDCITFSANRPRLMRKLRQQRLANVLSTLQNQEYDNLDLPKMPDELSTPWDANTMSETEFNRILGEYVASVASYLEQGNKRVPALTLSLLVREHVLMVLPTQFTIENNPLEEFRLSYKAGKGGPKDDDADLELHDLRQIVEFFHAGLPAFRLDLNKVFVNYQQQQQQQSEPEPEPEKHIERLRSLHGLTYDQCALACLDSKCGVFSYCEEQNDCVISKLTTIQQAVDAELLTIDKGCLVSQRDYVQHFQKYDNVQVPQDLDVGDQLESVITVNDCASSCVTETKFNCYSFEVCSNSETKEKFCHKHDHRRAGQLYFTSDPNGNGSNSTTSSKPFSCDHYERSYLAEFTYIEMHQINPARLHRLKSSEYFGKTAFDCADICLNELSDCSAFQFCFRPNADKDQIQAGGNFGQSCTMIQSKPDGEYWQAGSEYVVDDEEPEFVNMTQDDLKLDRNFLDKSDSCHVFSLKPNTIQAHLRSLAMGQTMTSHERDQLKHEEAARGVEFSWLGLIMLMLSLIVVSAGAGFALCWARERNDLVRYHMDQVQATLSKPFSRFTG
uniref:Uncharacterized protein n=1 Tax=Aceria tosichella TaxID=561515 RepID=A0A6G1SQY1_9ACAR